MTTPRRRYLYRLGATLCAVGLAGCADTGGEPTVETEETTPTEESETSTEESETPTDSSPENTETESGELHADYEMTDIQVRTPDGELLGEVTAAIADTPDTRFLGLSDTESLPEDRGMLFVFEAVAEYTFVMREMDFGIDIIFADADREITTIHHAPEPGPDEDGESQTYPGVGRYVLEVNIGWTTDRGIETGDVLEFEL